MKILTILFLFWAIALYAELGWQKDGSWNAKGFSSDPLIINVNTDDFVINQGRRAVLEIESDSPTAPSRDIILTCPPRAGLKTVLIKTGTGGWRLLDNLSLDGSCGGSVRLTANYTAAAAGSGTLTLISTSTGDLRETGRANN